MKDTELARRIIARHELNQALEMHLLFTYYSFSTITLLDDESRILTLQALAASN